MKKNGFKKNRNGKNGQKKNETETGTVLKKRLPFFCFFRFPKKNRTENGRKKTETETETETAPTPIFEHSKF
jgi:hypothetical protein